MLNNSKETGHFELEPNDNDATLSAETFQNTLKTFSKEVDQSKGIERTLLVKKHIKQVNYTKDEITVSLFYKTSCVRENIKSPASGRAGAAAGRSDKTGNKKSPWGTPGGFEVVKDFKSEQTVDIVLPNTIHGCRKKDL